MADSCMADSFMADYCMMDYSMMDYTAKRRGLAPDRTVPGARGSTTPSTRPRLLRRIAR